MTAEIIPFDRHDEDHPTIHHVQDGEVDVERLLMVLGNWSATFHIIAAGNEPMAAAAAREALVYNPPSDPDECPI